MPSSDNKSKLVSIQTNHLHQTRLSRSIQDFWQQNAVSSPVNAIKLTWIQEGEKPGS